MEIKWETLGNAWNDAYALGIPEISGDDLHALALWLFGEPSPRGYRAFDLELLQVIADAAAPAPSTLDTYRRVAISGDERAAACWALRVLKIAAR